MIKKYVIAGSYQAYLRWLSDTENNPENCRYITREKDIVGIDNPDKITFGNLYWENPLFEMGIPVVEKAKKREGMII